MLNKTLGTICLPVFRETMMDDMDIFTYTHELYLIMLEL